MRLDVIPGPPETTPVRFVWRVGTALQLIDPKLLRKMAGAIEQWQMFTSYAREAVLASQVEVLVLHGLALSYSVPSPAVSLINDTLADLADAALYIEEARTMLVNDLSSATAMQSLLVSAEAEVFSASSSLDAAEIQMDSELSLYPLLLKSYRLAEQILAVAVVDTTNAKNSAVHVVNYFDPDHPAYLGIGSGGFSPEQIAALLSAFLAGATAYWAIVGGSFEDAIVAYLGTAEGAALWAAYTNAVANPQEPVIFSCPVVAASYLDFSNRNFAFVLPRDSNKADSAFDLSKIINPNFKQQQLAQYPNIVTFLNVIRNSAGFGSGIGSSVWYAGMRFSYFEEVSNGTVVATNPYAVPAASTEFSEKYTICWISNVKTKNLLTGDSKVDFAIKVFSLTNAPDYYDPITDQLSSRLAHLCADTSVLVGGFAGEILSAFGFFNQQVRSDTLVRVRRYSKDQPEPQEIFSIALPPGVGSIADGPPTYNIAGGAAPYQIGDEALVAYTYARLLGNETQSATLSLSSSVRGTVFTDTFVHGPGEGPNYSIAGFQCSATPEGALRYAIVYVSIDTGGSGLMKMRLRSHSGDLLLEEHSYLRGFFYVHGVKLDINVNGVVACTTWGTEEGAEGYGHYWLVKIGANPRYRLYLTSDFSSQAAENLEKPMLCFWTPDGRYLVASLGSGVTKVFNESGVLIFNGGSGGPDIGGISHGVPVSRECTQVGGAVVVGETTERSYKWIIVSANSTVTEGIMKVVEHTTLPTVVTFVAGPGMARRWTSSVFDLGADDTRISAP